MTSETTVTFQWKWLFFTGLVLVLLGILALLAPLVATITSVVVFGWVLLLGGIMQLIFAITNRQNSHFLMQALIALLTGLTGILMLLNPTLTAMALTLLLAVFFISIGIFRIFTTLILRFPHWGWVLVGGVLSLILGILMLVHWPSSALWVIGLFIGIELLFSGWTFITTALVFKKAG